MHVGAGAQTRSDPVPLRLCTVALRFSCSTALLSPNASFADNLQNCRQAATQGISHRGPAARQAPRSQWSDMLWMHVPPDAH